MSLENATATGNLTFEEAYDLFFHENQSLAAATTGFFCALLFVLVMAIKEERKYFGRGAAGDRKQDVEHDGEEEGTELDHFELRVAPVEFFSNGDGGSARGSENSLMLSVSEETQRPSLQTPARESDVEVVREQSERRSEARRRFSNVTNFTKCESWFNWTAARTLF